MNIYDVEKVGFVDEEIDPSLNLVDEINKLKREKNAVILAHYYQNPEIQDIADFVGDSLSLSQQAERAKANIIVFAGVSFMAETAKILSPESKVILPDLNAGCSLADSCKYDDFKRFIDNHPHHVIITYINTSADIKTLSHICCTSSNAVNVINSVPEHKPIIFAPDRNLGNYLKALSKRENMIIWDGACHVHEQFSLVKLLKLKEENPNAPIIAHPECPKPILIVADFIGSTQALLNYSHSVSHANTFIVATEVGILHQMARYSPTKTFIPAPPNDSTCACNECSYMKLVTLKKLYLSLKYELPEINVDNNIIDLARIPIHNMLNLK